MCFNPISINNPRIDFRIGVDANTVTVPCGKCLECRKRKRDDWFVRLYYEFKRVVKSGKGSGCVLYPTFTYNDDNLPFFEPNDERLYEVRQYGEIPDVRFSGFDKVTVINAVKKLRTRMARQGMDNFKYFIVCERGEDENYTFRPHYHCLFFFDSYLDADAMRDEFEYAWSYKVAKEEVSEIFRQLAEKYFASHPDQSLFCPRSTKKDKLYLYIAHKNKYNKIHYFCKRGNVTYAKTDSGIIRPYVDNSDSLSYVTKYIHKQQSYEKDIAIIEYEKWLSNLPKVSSEELKGTKYKDIRDSIKFANSFKHFVLSSNNIGIDLFDDLQLRSELALTHEELLKKNLVPNRITIEQKVYAIPTYILDKLFYSTSDVYRTVEYRNHNNHIILDIHHTKKRFYTELGKKVVSLRLKQKVHDMSGKYQLFMSDSFLTMLKDFVFTEGLFSEYDKLMQKCELVQHIIHRDNIDYEMLSLYKLCLRNVVIPDIPIFDDFDFKAFCYDMYIYKVNTFGDVSECFRPPLSDRQTYEFIHTLPIFNNLKNFANYDLVLDYIEQLKAFINYAKMLDVEKQHQVSQKLVEFYKKYLYV